MLRVNGVEIEDTFAEAFPMRAARAIVTAETAGWARTAADAGDRLRDVGDRLRRRGGHRAEIPAGGRRPTAGPGVSLLVFGFNTAALGKALVNRVGQCVMTCPTTACYNGLAPARRPSRSAASSASSATGTRPARSSTGGATGASR